MFHILFTLVPIYLYTWGGGGVVNLSTILVDALGPLPMLLLS